MNIDEELERTGDTITLCEQEIMCAKPEREVINIPGRDPPEDDIFNINMSETIYNRSVKDKRPFVRVIIDEVEVQALLDSGANCSVIGAEVARMIDIGSCTKTHGPFRLAMADWSRSSSDTSMILS